VRNNADRGTENASIRAIDAAPQGRMVGGVHIYPVRVYYEDTDVGGVVYYANYLKFAERARTEMLRVIGFPHGEMMARDGRAFAVRRCEADYIRPARFDDALEVHTDNIDMEAAGFWLDQRVKRDGQDLAILRVRLACIGQSGKPARLPPALRAALLDLKKSAGGAERCAAGHEDGKESSGIMDQSLVKERV
jgi:acyl-CoA thioester hydrolase